ncbi:MAG: hypothetical protein ACXAEX_21785 [Promethearchaeota archaeon]|jgi:hypothetical protein
MAKIDVRCPVCSNWEKIDISDDITENAKKGIVAINITAGMICEHSFIAYVDKNLSVRDSLIADFKIEAPETSDTNEVIDATPQEIETIKFDLIKLNIPEVLMASIFRSIFLGKDVILISDDQFLATHIINFFNYAKKNIFDTSIIAMSKLDYKNDKKKYADYIVFEKGEIIQDKHHFINLKKLTVEKNIARKFLGEYDLVTGLIILKNEIQKAITFSKTISEFIINSANKNWTSKILIDHIADTHHEKIQVAYLTFLLDIVKYYYKVEVPKIDGVSDFLGFL